jgi:branched-subunit amino acid aminotransferase/4-amino-4-deoxychorismate lyase
MINGVFTTIQVTNGIPLFLAQHKKRLSLHAKELGFNQPTFSDEEVKHFLQKNQLTDCALKILLMKLQGKTIISMETRPLPQIKQEIMIITVPDTRNELKIYKTIDRFINEQAMKLANEKEADDALFIHEGMIIESTICNVFSLNDQGDIITPPLDGKGLKGIIRQIIMDKLPIIEEEIQQNTMNPLVLVNSLRMQTVTHLDGRPLNDASKLFMQLKKIIDEA